MAINSRKKGSRNERNLARLWQKYTGKEFTKTPSSGGLGWKRKSDTSGDIICTDEKHSRFFAFSIEAKAYKSINFNHLLLSVESDILKFWEQAKGDADKAKKTALLFMRYNGMPKNHYFLAMDKDYYDQLEVHLPQHESMIINLAELSLAIINSPSFFATNYEEVHKLTKQVNRDNYGN